MRLIQHDPFMSLADSFKAELNAPQDVITCARKSANADGSFLGLPQCIPMNATQIGLVSSLFTLGGLCGALVGGPLAARYGRITPMRINTLCLSLGPVAEALAPNIAIMTIGRFVSGIGAGASLVVVPIYISEIAPPSQKGFFGAFTQIMCNAGILLTQVLGLFLSRGQMWRFILAVAGIVAGFQFLGLFLAVESPKYQADNGNPSGAKETLRRIRGHKVDLQAEIDGWGVQGEDVAEGWSLTTTFLRIGADDMGQDEREALLDNEAHIQPHAAPSKSQAVKTEALGIFDVIVHPKYNRAAVAVIAVMLAQQFTGKRDYQGYGRPADPAPGINSIVMYGVSLLAGLLKSNSALLNVFVSLLNLVVTFSCAPLPDIIGRKPAILGSIAGMGTSSVLLAIGIRSSIPTLSAIAVLAFVASFGFGLGPVPFILSSELVGPEAVGATQTWALVANWLATFAVAQFFPLVNEMLGKGVVYFVFGGLAVFFFAFIAWWVPETKGKKSAEEVWGLEARRED